MMDAKNMMEEEIKLNFKLEKCVVLPGKLSGYHTEGFLGQGCYGNVVKCTKLNTKEVVAVKIVRKDCFREGKKEARTLKKIRQLNPEKNNLLRLIENFKYKGHCCLAFEMLDMSIFDFMCSRHYAPLHLSEIRVIAQQLLVALNALKSVGLVHADIKPDNIMLVNHKLQPFKVKLIDFGLAVKASKLWFAGTVQAIGYRSPEVILGLNMDESVDMWSLGCCLAYMYLGYNLYPTQCVYEVIKAIVQIHGQPRDDLLKKAMDVQHFFTKLTDSSDRMYRLKTPAEYTTATGFATQLKGGIYKRLQCLDDLLKTRPRPADPWKREDGLRFISLLKWMLMVDPMVRITPKEALGHHFITMKHLSGGRSNSYVASARKVMTDCQPQDFVEDHYATSSDVATRKMLHAKKHGQIEDAANRLEDEAHRSRTFRKVRPRFTSQQEGAEQTDTAIYRRKDEPSDEEQLGRTFIRVRPLFAAHRESAGAADKPACKSKHIPLGHRGGNTNQQKGSESKASGKALKDKEWEGRGIIKVKPYSSAESKGNIKFNSTTAGTQKKTEIDGISCKDGKLSDLVEVKTCRISMKKARNVFSRLIGSFSCMRRCE